jgi:diguanylate cyclase (GGDEF)-like protein
MSFPLLDLPTLLVTTAIGVGFSGLMLLLARGREADSRTAALWGSAMLLGALGFCVFAFGQTYGFAALLAGDTAIVLAAALSWNAAQMFAGGRPLFRFAMAGPVILLAWAVLTGNRGEYAHIVFTVIIVAAYTLATAAELAGDRRERLRSRNAAIAVLLLHTVYQICRAIFMAAAPDVARRYSHALYETVFLEAFLYTMSMAFLLLAMMKERAEQQATVNLRHLTMIDDLTGLGNRRQFDFALASAVQNAARNQAPLAMLMIDADYFKNYNDAYGHRPGDECLRVVASAIRVALRRPEDVATRYGGEEFAVLLAAHDEAAAISVAEDIRVRIAALAIEHAGSPWGMVTVSVGVASVAPGRHGNLAEELVRAADRALYVAKSTGRNRTHAASEARESALRPLERL